jgi:hypothetical protein
MAGGGRAVSLYHYTCRHSMSVIGTGKGLLLPAWSIYDEQQRARADEQTRALAELVWLTDLEAPVAEALGLTRSTLRCDRTGYRYRVTDDQGIVRYVSMRRRLSADVRAGLETAPGAMPMHWWVSYEPVLVVFDPVSVVVS